MTISGWDAAISLVLIALAVGLSMWLRLGVERSLIWAAARAAAQLVAVGLFFRVIFESADAIVWAWAWVVVMVAVASDVARRRAPTIPGIRWAALVAIAGGVGVTIVVVFGLGALDYGPVSLVVISGITIGNTMPGTVLAVTRLTEYFRTSRGEVEALLALGFDAAGARRFVMPLTARTALIPQIERTRVVGLIALPGAMTGLLLAGVDPMDAILVQLVVLYLVLGSSATAVTLVTWFGARAAFTPDQRLAGWVVD